jgi:hypothetical protein
MNIGLPLYPLKDGVIDLTKVKYISKPYVNTGDGMWVMNIAITIDGDGQSLCELPDNMPAYFGNPSMEEKEQYHSRCQAAADLAYEQLITAWYMVTTKMAVPPKPPKPTEERRLDTDL